VGVQSPVAVVPSTRSGWFRSTDESNSMVEDLPTAESWTSPADNDFRAARAVASPALGETSSAGLPRRAPGANLLPGSVSQPAGRHRSPPVGGGKTQSAGGIPTRGAAGPLGRAVELRG
jgi:hypothetical protein